MDLEDIGFVVAPRLNAAGRVGEAARAARLLLAGDRTEADALADEIEKANLDRREMTRVALAEARRHLGLDTALGVPAERGACGSSLTCQPRCCSRGSGLSASSV